MGNPAGQGNLPDHRQSDSTADAQPQLPEAAIAALSRGCKIDAIKLVHQQQGLGLKDSKDLVEAYMRQHPQLRNAPAMQGVTAQKSRYSMTVGVLVLLLVALMLGLMFF